MKHSLAPRLAGVLAAVALAALSAAPVALAAPAGKTTHSKKTAAHTVYVCTK